MRDGRCHEMRRARSFSRWKRPTFSKEKLGAPTESIHAPHRRGSALGGARPQSTRDQYKPRHQPHQRAQLPGTRAAGWPELNWLEVHHEHKRGKHVTLQLLHLEYKAIYPDGWGYTQSCAHYRRWLARQDVVMRLEYAAGERMFVDFAGDTVPITDPRTGEVWDAQIFVSVLGASGYLYAEAVRSQDVASWLGAHVRALEFYGGSVRLVVSDYVPGHIIGLLWPTGLCGRRQPRA